jgi:hypothetical protein
MLADYPELGTICRLHTSSYHSIRQIHSALVEIQGITGGRLTGLTVPMVVSPQQTTFDDNGKKRTTTIYTLSIQLRSQDMQNLLGSMTKMAGVFESTRKALGAKHIVVVEDESDRAAEIPPEFPRRDEPKALPEAPESAKATEPPPPAEKAAPAAATPPPQASQTASEKPKSEKPKVEKLAVKFHGMPKAMTENAIASGPNKGKPFWKLTLEAAGGDVTLLVFSSTVREKIDGAIKRSQEVELDCESQVRAENSFTKVNDVVFLTKTPEPEPAGEEPPADWMLD